MLHSLYLFINIHSYFFVYSSFSQIYTGNNNYGCRIKLEIIHSTTRFGYLYIFLIADPSPTIIYRFASKFLTHALIFKIIGSRAILFWMQSYKSRISIILYLLQELSCYLFKKINKTSTNSVQKIVKIVYDLHRIAIGILLRISISWKKKKRKEKGGEKILRKNISNFNQFPIPRTAQLNHSFTTIQKLSKSSPNQYQDTCVVSHSRIEASSRSNFLETKIYNFPHTHTHIRTQPRKSAHATKKLPSCRGQLLHPSPFPLPSLVLFRPVIAIYALERPFLFVSHCLSIPNQRFLSRFIDRLSRYWIVRSILTTFVYLYGCYAEYLRDVNQIPFVELSCFVFFRSTRLLLLFSIGWKMVDRLESCWKYFERR